MLAFLLTISDEINHPKIMHLYNRYHKDMIKFARSVFFEKRKINYIIDAEDANQKIKIKGEIIYEEFITQ